jgi:hypothetical protein
VNVNVQGPPPDTAAPSVSVTSPAAGATVSGSVTLAASASDNVGVVGVRFSVDGVAVGSEDTTVPYSVQWDTSQRPPGTYTITAFARDAAGNATTSQPVVVTVPAPPSVPGRVLALGFNEASGTTAADASGGGLNGTLLNGPSWVTAGRYGGAIDFDGSDDMVRVSDAAALDLTNRFTIAAWVRPDTLNNWHTLAMKSTTGGIAYGLYTSGFQNNRPTAFVHTGTVEHFARASTALSTTAWRHLAVTYDGTTMRFYIDGVAAGSGTFTAQATTSDQPLYIGGNTVWSYEDYAGLIDELQIYNRALTATEITTIKNTPIA